MADLTSPVNLNIPATPKGVPEELFSEFNRLYNALRNLNGYIGSDITPDLSAVTANRGAGVLVGGSVVVANANVTAGCLIFLTPQILGTVATPKAVAITARTPGVSFTITSEDVTDTSTIGWWFVL